MNPQEKRYAANLKKLKQLLKKPRTARELARLLDCAPWTITKRINALRDEGVKIVVGHDSSRPGPAAPVYSIC